MSTKIKLIATDVDGTLVKESSKDVYDELITAVQKLVDCGVHFVVASGRQYNSIYQMFERTNRKLDFIAENGAHVVLNGENFSVTKMNRQYVEEIMADLRALYDEGCKVVVSTDQGSYMEDKDPDFYNLIRYGYRNKVTVVDDVLAVDANVIKIAIYKKGNIRPIGESQLIPKWQDKVKTCMAGEEWVDFMDKSVDKGNALKVIQSELGVTPEETVVFGDNNNDLGLILSAVESYAVENAVPEVKSAAKHVCDDYTKHGVCKVLEHLLENDLRV